MFIKISSGAQQNDIIKASSEQQSNLKRWKKKCGKHGGNEIFLFVSCLDRSRAMRRLLVVFVSPVEQKQLISREFPSPTEHSNSFKKYHIENISAKSETF